MILVWGHKGYCDLLGYVIERCPQCSTAGPFSVKQVRKKFTVYFVPTFSYGSKQYAECFACHSAFEIPKEQQQRIAGALMTHEQLSALIRDIQSRAAAQRAVETQQAIDSSTSTKQCPYCAEDIKTEAVFCRFCRRDLLDDRSPQGMPAPLPDKIVVACETCGQQLRVPVRERDLKVTCSACRRQFVLRGCSEARAAGRPA